MIGKIRSSLQRILSGKFGRDVLFNVFAFGLIGGLSVLNNFIIAFGYSAEALGIFIQAYSLYYIFAQITVGGIHLSTLSLIGLNTRNTREMPAILTSALLLVLLYSVVVCGAIYALRFQISGYFGGEGMIESIAYIAPGIGFFALNKVFLAYLNGKRKMIRFGSFQMLRLVLLTIFLVGMILAAWRESYLTLAVTLAEAMVFLVLLITHLPAVFAGFSGLGQWINRHLKFSGHAFLGNILLDLNYRADILIVGFFLTNTQVGVYSLAAETAKGFLQLSVVLRNNMNPVLSRLSHLDRAKVEGMLAANVRTFIKSLSPLTLVVIAVFGAAVMLSDKVDPTEALAVHVIMMVSSIWALGYIPIQMIFNQWSLPRLQTGYFFSCTLVLMVAVFLGSFWWGSIGAAFGFGLFMIAQVILLKVFVKRYLGIHI